jgi:hypothetical protein
MKEAYHYALSYALDDYQVVDACTSVLGLTRRLSLYPKLLCALHRGCKVTEAEIHKGGGCMCELAGGHKATEAKRITGLTSRKYSIEQEI